MHFMATSFMDDSLILRKIKKEVRQIEMYECMYFALFYKNYYRLRKGFRRLYMI